MYVYRGVHAEHPTIAYARNGEVVPGKINGRISASTHNEGGWEDRSPLPRGRIRMRWLINMQRKMVPAL
jgi:hypothetical protein